MAFNVNNKTRNKSSLPIAKKGQINFEPDERKTFRVGSARSDNSDDVKSENHKNLSTKNTKTKPSDPPSQPTKSKAGPLSKAMQRRPHQISQERQSETYADEKLESISSKLRGKTQVDHKKRREDMEHQLQEAETQLKEMKGLLDKRQKLMEEKENNFERTKSDLEERIANQDEKLITNGIDPVTGERIPSSKKDKENVEKKRKFTKKYIEEMREKLKQMNTQTESMIENIELTVNYLDSLETASHQAGPVSDDVQKIVDETGLDKFIAKIYSENSKSQKDGEDEQQIEREGPSGRGTPEEEQNEHEETEEQTDEGQGEESQVFLTARALSAVEQSDYFKDYIAETSENT